MVSYYKSSDAVIILQSCRPSLSPADKIVIVCCCLHSSVKGYSYNVVSSQLANIFSVVVMISAFEISSDLHSTAQLMVLVVV